MKNNQNKEELNLIDFEVPKADHNIEVDVFLDEDDKKKDERVNLLKHHGLDEKVISIPQYDASDPEKYQSTRATRQVYESNPNSEDPKNTRMWHVAHYQGYFDINTEIFLKRVKLSLWPFTNQNFFSDDEPFDLYGPFWITSTLIIAIIMLSSLIEKFNAALNPDQKFVFHVANIANFTATTAFFLFLVPLGLKFGVSFYTSQKVEYFKMLSLYGYSFAIFVPMCVLYLLPLQVFRFLIVIIAALISGYFVRKEIIHMFNEPHHVKIVTLGLLGLQIIFALIFKFYFIA